MSFLVLESCETSLVSQLWEIPRDWAGLGFARRHRALVSYSPAKRSKLLLDDKVNEPDDNWAPIPIAVTKLHQREYTSDLQSAQRSAASWQQ